ncbi:zona pellucida sperm-binding protein 3 [Salarias fasciatus]|uniref:zona pellucida sperm-binding protein 3 n=1 Tax=Salarias fasciatus TaxID=181472 RepID=UPI001176896F|nr:zona pellucida sperm-binding protein 3-like [Salarias fasciatus]
MSPSCAASLLIAEYKDQVTTIPEGGSDKSKDIEVLCHIDRMYVRVRRDMFKTPHAYKFLKLGRCPVNAGKKEHFFLLHALKSNCGFKKMSNKDCVIISIVLTFHPNTPILRDLPFEVKLQCRYPRFFHSYKVGFIPQIQGGTVYRQLPSRSTFVLTPQDESGNNIMGSRTFVLGQPMFFQAGGPSSMTSAGQKRVYIQKCHITISQNPNASPSYTVIDNQGCMIESKITPTSAFIKGNQKKIQRFTVPAFIFKDQASSASTQQLFMHCQIYVGPLTPTPSSKACNFDPVSKKWKELHGPNSVCDCCESTCPSPHPRGNVQCCNLQSVLEG